MIAASEKQQCTRHSQGLLIALSLSLEHRCLSVDHRVFYDSSCLPEIPFFLSFNCHALPANASQLSGI